MSVTLTQAQIEAALDAYAQKLTEIFDQQKDLTPQDREAAMIAALTAAAEVGRMASLADEKLVNSPNARTAAAEVGKKEITSVDVALAVEAATIERCAQVAESFPNTGDPHSILGMRSRSIAAAIRALKDS